MHFRDLKDAGQLRDRLDRLAETKIMVYGDYMLDRYISGSVERISPEAPVPIVSVKREWSAPGGAGNVVVNLLSLGLSVLCFGFIGNDDAAFELNDLLEDAGADTTGFVIAPGLITTTKTRIVGREQTLLRIDWDDCALIEPEVGARMAETAALFMGECKALVLSDYRRGAMVSDVVAPLITAAGQANIPVVGDPKPENATVLMGVDVVCPNSREWDGIVQRRGIGSASLIVTEGAAGLRVAENGFRDGKAFEHFPATCTPDDVVDVCGAGDTVTALVACGLAVEFSLYDAALLANVAAGLVVRKRGCASVTREELETAAAEYVVGQ
jgi:rfaE bifunctional protein kinase chain/domain